VLCSQFIIVYGLMGYEPLTYEQYVYPVWANVLGWVIAGSSISMIPGMAVYKLATTPGTLMQVSHCSDCVTRCSLLRTLGSLLSEGPATLLHVSTSDRKTEYSDLRIC
jgi:hypothetical protein